MKNEIKNLVKVITSKDKNRDAYFRYCTERDLDILLHYLPKRGKILDVGGGYGRLAIPLAKLGYDVYLLEPVKEILELAELYAKREKVSITLKRGSILDIPYPDEYFDAVTAMRDVLNYCGNPERGIVELARVCKKGGTVAISCGSIYSRLTSGRPLKSSVEVKMLYRSIIEKEAVPTGEGFMMVRFSVEDIKKLFHLARIKILKITGDTIVLPLIKENAYKILRDKSSHRKIKEIDKVLSKDENLLNFFDHIVAVGKRM
jgi:ubiquinone/menaquinone biosynthesis C-methylase UbiE